MADAFSTERAGSGHQAQEIALRTTIGVVVDELPIRVVSAIWVCLTMAVLADWRLAVAWLSVSAVTEALEVLTYRGAGRSDGPLARWIPRLCVVTAVSALVYAAPALVFATLDLSFAGFLAAGYILGSILHLNAHYSHVRAIWFAAALPNILYFALAAFIMVEGSAYDRAEVYLIVMLSVMLFITGMVTNFRGQLAVHRRLGQATADALAHGQAVQQASEAKSQFLANTSHEVRTPLNGILGMAQVLAQSRLSPEQQGQVETILDSGRTLLAILNDVLDLSKIEAGRMDLAPVDQDLRGVLARVCSLWRVKAEEKGLAFRLSVEESVPALLHFDPVRVRQCVSNLVSNAIKFTERGAIEIRVRSESRDEAGPCIAITVEDTGAGMAPETLERLFRPFMQADESTSRRFGGTGLGLSISRELARLMGGDLTATSILDQGSTFTFTFQAGVVTAQAPDTADHPFGSQAEGHSAIVAPGAPLKVLLVDDNRINRQVARLFLRAFSADVREAENGQEALDHLDTERFDLVLLDMHMPVMDGPETIRRIRSDGHSYAQVPVVALTADAMVQDRERYLAMGLDGYLSKPLGMRELSTEIARQCPHLRETPEAAQEAGTAAPASLAS